MVIWSYCSVNDVSEEFVVVDILHLLESDKTHIALEIIHCRETRRGCGNQIWNLLYALEILVRTIIITKRCSQFKVDTDSLFIFFGVLFL